MVEARYASGLHDPRRDRGDAHVAADADDHEDQRDGRAARRLLLEREYLQTSDDGREEIRDRQPQVDRDVLGEPVGKRALESVED